MQMDSSSSIRGGSPVQRQTECMDGPTPKPLKAPELKAWLSNSPDLTLVDVREDQELTMAPFPHSVEHLPLSRAEHWMG